MSEQSQAQIIALLATKDPILVKEARSRLRPVTPPPPEPNSTVELLGRVHERPEYVPRLAAILQREMRDTATKQWYLWLRVANDLAHRQVDVDAVVRLYHYALDAESPGHYFARGWRLL